MKFAFLFSGALGFALVGGVGFVSGRDLDLVLRDAALGCLATAWLGAWFWRRLDHAFAQTLAARQAAQAALAAQEEAAQSPAAPAPSPTPAPTRR